MTLAGKADPLKPSASATDVIPSGPKPEEKSQLRLLAPTSPFGCRRRTSPTRCYAGKKRHLARNFSSWRRMTRFTAAKCARLRNVSALSRLRTHTELRHTRDGVYQ